MIRFLAASAAPPTLGAPPASASDAAFLWALARELGRDQVTAPAEVLRGDALAAALKPLCDGRAEQRGVGTYASEQRAEARWRDACDRGEPQAWCERDPAACDEAAFLAAGAPAVVRYDGVLSPKDVDRTLADLRAPTHACVRAALERRARPPELVEVHWRIEVDGSVWNGGAFGRTSSPARSSPRCQDVLIPFSRPRRTRTTWMVMEPSRRRLRIHDGKEKGMETS